MAILLILLSVVALLDGIISCGSATTIMQQIAGRISLGIAAVLFSGGAIANEIVLLRRKPQEQIKASKGHERDSLEEK